MNAKEKSWADRWVNLGGVRTHYVEAGDGEPVVLIHGGGPGASGAHGWPHMIPALAAHYRVLAIDMIGFGETDKPAGLTYSHQDHVDHLASFVSTLCLAPVRLIGNSWGAYVAAKYALDHPDDVLKVFTISSATIAQAMGLSPPENIPGRKAYSGYDGSEQAMRDFLGGILLQPPPEELVAARHRMANLPGAPEAGAAMRAYLKRLAEDTNLEQRFSIRERLPRLTIPFYILWGREDRFAPASLADELRGLLPNVTIEVMDDAGHQAQTDRPEEVNRRVLDFLA